MRALSLCVLVLLVAALAAAVEPARACSCAQPDPRSALAAADGAFVGTMVSRRETTDFRAILTFDVERALKGSFGERVEVVTARDSAGCGLEMPVGTRTGLVLDRRDGVWHGHLCAQFAPADLLAAVQPLPAPNGKGPVALLVGGRFGPARLMALDRQGRTLAYGNGAGNVIDVSVCPGGQRLVEVAALDNGRQLAIRETRTLRVVRRQTLRLPGARNPVEVLCDAPDGSNVLLFAQWQGDAPQRAAIYRVTGPRLSAIWNGTAYHAALTPRVAYLSAGFTGTKLLRVDVRSRLSKRIGSLPWSMTLVPNASGTRLAGVAYRLDRKSHIVLVDLTRLPAKTVTAALSAAEVTGGLFWLGLGRLVFVPFYGQDSARVLDSALRTQSRFRWTAGKAAHRGSTVFGLGGNGALVAADLPSGPMRTIRRLPSPTAYTIFAA